MFFALTLLVWSYDL